MNIKEVIYSHNNDFKAIFACPLCKHEYTAWGYSDHNFYYNVMPNAICPRCKMNSHGETEEKLKARTGRTYVI